MPKTKSVVREAPTKPATVAEYVSLQLRLCGKDQTEVAQEVGFNKPNVLTMIKQGKTKVPLERIGPLAKAMGVDPVFFFRMVVNEYLPTLMPIIEGIFNAPIISQNELEFIDVVRSAKVINPKLRTEEERRQLRKFVDTLKGDNETREG